MSLARTGIIVAARMGSTRLPGKALRPLMGIPSILFLLRRLVPSRLASRIVLATTTLAEDDPLADLVEAEGIAVFRGHPSDLIRRHVDAAQAHDFHYAVRVTGDCPLVDAQTVDMCMAMANDWQPFDLASTKPVWPIGIDYEIFNVATMAALLAEAPLTPAHREHLTLYLYENEPAFRVRRFSPPAWRYDRENGPSFTLDTSDDLDRLDRLVRAGGDPLVPAARLVELAQS